MFNKLEKILGPLPYVRESAGVLGRFSYLGYESVHRFASPTPFIPFNKDEWDRKTAMKDYSAMSNPTRPYYQRPEVRGWVPRPVYRSDELYEWSALMKCFIKMSVDSRFGAARYASRGFESLNPQTLTDAFYHQTVTSDSRKLLQDFRGFKIPQSSDDAHLHRSALHGAVTLKRRWAPSH